MPAHSQFFKPPQQIRSQETFERIRDATEKVLEEKAFDEATLAEIMDRAGVTVGAFYRRYPDKNALLRHLDERFFAERMAWADDILDPARWANATLSQVINAFAQEAVAVCTTRRGLLRSLFLGARTDTVLRQTALHANERFIAKLHAVLMPHRNQIANADPERAIELGYMMMIGTLRELIVFGETWPSPPARTPALAAEVSRMYSGYLGIG